MKEQQKWCIYKHTNKINGKIYIGQAKGRPELRWGRKGSNYKSSVLFYRAIQKYGWNNFCHEILFNDLTEDEAKCKTKPPLTKKTALAGGRQSHI